MNEVEVGFEGFSKNLSVIGMTDDLNVAKNANLTCAVCGKEARDQVSSLDIGIEYPEGEKRWIRMDEHDFEEGAFCHAHFLGFVALKVENFRRFKQK